MYIGSTGILLRVRKSLGKLGPWLYKDSQGKTIWVIKSLQITDKHWFASTSGNEKPSRHMPAR